MTASRVAIGGAVVAVAGWGLKAVAIWSAGGLDLSPFEAPLFILGLVGIVVAFVGLGLAVASRRSRTLKFVGAILGALIGFGLSALVANAVGSLVPDSAGWVREEAGLWVSSILTLTLALIVARRNQAPA